MNLICNDIYIGTAIEAECVVNGTMDCINGPGDAQICAILNVGRYESYSVPRKCRIEYNKVSLRQGNNEDNIDLLISAFHIVDYYVKKHMPVLVHCRAGYVRSPAVVCTWIMLRKRMTYENVLYYIRQQHKMGDRMGDIIVRTCNRISGSDWYEYTT